MSRLAAMAAIYCVGCASATKPCATEPPNASQIQEAMTPPAANAALSADNPTVSDPDKYTAVMENARVRVLRYHDEPGAKTHPHHHPDSVLYALSAFRRRLTFPDGTTKERDFKAGDVMWVPAQTHVGENTGTTQTEVLLVEVKRGRQCDRAVERRRNAVTALLLDTHAWIWLAAGEPRRRRTSPSPHARRLNKAAMDGQLFSSSPS